MNAKTMSSILNNLQLEHYQNGCLAAKCYSISSKVYLKNSTVYFVSPKL
jgi:hypothetical protein